MRMGSIFKSVCRIYANSQKNIHFALFLLALCLSLVIRCLGLEISVSGMESTLNGVAVISAFFLLALSNMDFAYLNENFTKPVKVGMNREVPESVRVRSTVFSLSLSSVALAGSCFGLNLFGIGSLFMLVWLLLYLFLGIGYALVLWNFFASKKNSSPPS